MKLLVTGIAGFIGSHLAERLLARGDTVVGLDSFDPFYPRAIKERNLQGLGSRARVIEGDILDAALVGEVFREGAFDAVVHLAGLAGVRPSLAQPARYQRINVEGTALLAEAALEHGVGRFVFASSSSVYGASARAPFAETERADEPLSPYAASKRSAELVLRSLHHVRGLGVSVLRYFTVYGPRQRPEMAIHAFCRAIARGEPIPIHGAGGSSRDYTYVDDAVAGTVSALDHAGEGFRIYNLGGGSQPTTLMQLVEHISGALGEPARVEHRPEVVGDVQHTVADISAARAELGYAPTVDIREGVKRFVSWYRAQPPLAE